MYRRNDSKHAQDRQGPIGGLDLDRPRVQQNHDRSSRSEDEGGSARGRAALRVHLRLASCRNLLMREARKSIDRWNLTLPQFDVLAELARADERGFTFIELSHLLLVTSGNLTGIVDRLEREQLVRREPDPGDRRVIRIRLTNKGRRLTERMLPRHADDINQVLMKMPKDQLAQLGDLLGELRYYLHERAGEERSTEGRWRRTFRNV